MEAALENRGSCPNLRRYGFLRTMLNFIEIVLSLTDFAFGFITREDCFSFLMCVAAFSCLWTAVVVIMNLADTQEFMRNRLVIKVEYAICFALGGCFVLVFPFFTLCEKKDDPNIVAASWLSFATGVTCVADGVVKVCYGLIHAPPPTKEEEQGNPNVHLELRAVI